MRFAVTASLLVALRTRRDARPLAPPPSGEEISLLATMRALLSKRELDAKKLSARYDASRSALQHDVEDTHDAFVLHAGSGPTAYLTADGRVLLDGRSWDGSDVREATDDEAIAAIVTGANATGFLGLLGLLPPRPADAAACSVCHGGRRAQRYPGVGPEMVCLMCHGRGWVLPAPGSRRSARVRIATTQVGAPLYDETVRLRQRILRDPLGLVLDTTGDGARTFFVALEGERVVGTVALEENRLRAMAVDGSTQTRGVGRLLVTALEEEARARGIARVELHARVTAQGFYAKLGYVEEGEVFTEVTVPHIAMAKSL